MRFQNSDDKVQVGGGGCEGHVWSIQHTRDGGVSAPSHLQTTAAASLHDGRYPGPKLSKSVSVGERTCADALHRPFCSRNAHRLPGEPLCEERGGLRFSSRFPGMTPQGSHSWVGAFRSRRARPVQITSAARLCLARLLPSSPTENPASCKPPSGGHRWTPPWILRARGTLQTAFFPPVDLLGVLSELSLP